jgi:hypothetical protein
LDHHASCGYHQISQQLLPDISSESLCSCPRLCAVCVVLCARHAASHLVKSVKMHRADISLLHCALLCRAMPDMGMDRDAITYCFQPPRIQCNVLLAAAAFLLIFYLQGYA